MGLQQVAGAAEPLVTVDQAKAHCGIESSEWDAMLTGFITAATAHAQNMLGKALGSQSWSLTLDAFVDEIELPLGPVIDVSAITYQDSDRVARTLDIGTYILDLVSSPQRLVIDPDEAWPTTASVPNAVTIAFTTGYEAAPAPVVQAILLAVGSWWRDREAGVFPSGAMALLQPYRRILI